MSSSTITYVPHVGSSVERGIKTAIQKAHENNCFIEMIFNGAKVIVTKNSKYSEVYKNWRDTMEKNVDESYEKDRILEAISRSNS